MDTWPHATDYQEALQHPDRAFKDPELKRCRAESNALGRPRPRSGNFACVFKLENGARVFAVKLFKSLQGERAERYRLVSEHLERHGRPDFMVGFRYDPEGIRIAGDWFPVQTMDWVTGDTLDRWVAQRVQHRDAAGLRRMAEHWVRLVEQLRASGIAHGDLQHGNVMVVNDRPVLVDYDGMCVPALVGRTALEVGLPGYQHPQRKDQRLSLDLDHFSAWVILVALRALAADLSLWQRHVVATKNDNLLFTDDDLKTPDASPLWPDLLRSPDAEVRLWAGRLRDTLPDRPFAGVPVFQMDPHAALRAACRAASPDWDKIHALASGVRGRGPLPPELAGPCDEAARRVAARDRLQRAVAARSARQAAAAYDPKLHDDWPACGPLADFGRKAVPLVKLLDELDAVRKKPGNGRHLVNLWARHGARLTGIAETDTILDEVARWRQRIEACDAFKTALATAASTEKAIADAWDRLQAAGGHPDADAYRPRAEAARRRAELLDRLRRTSGGAGEDEDRAFAGGWDEDLLGACHEATALRPPLAGAHKRLDALREVEKTAGQADKGSADEAAVLKAAAGLPPGYGHRLAPRVAQARVRDEARARFLRVAQAPGSAERALADAWHQAVEAGGHLPAAVRAHRGRAEAARRRADLLDRLRSVPPTPAENNDRLFAQMWDEAVLKSCPEAEALRPRLQQVEERLRRLDEVQRLAAGELGPAEEAALIESAGRLPPGYPHRLAARVQQIGERARLRGELEALLHEEPPSDVAIAAAWDQVRAAGSLRHPRRTIERCELAARRRDCLRRLNGIGLDLPADEQDRAWLDLWDEALLDGCADADGARERHQLARDRVAAWCMLEEALATLDLGGVTELARHPLLDGYPPAEARRAEIEGLLRQAAERKRLLGMLRRGDPRELTDADLQFLRDNETMFRPQQELVQRLLGGWLAKEAALRPGDPVSRPGPRRGEVTVRWLWPHAGRVGYCYVAAHPERFLKRRDEAPDETTKVFFENHRRSGGFVLTALTDAAERLHVTVWPVLNLGWMEVLGDPLWLGPVVVPPAR